MATPLGANECELKVQKSIHVNRDYSKYKSAELKFTEKSAFKYDNNNNNKSARVDRRYDYQVSFYVLRTTFADKCAMGVLPCHSGVTHSADNGTIARRSDERD